MEDTFKIRDLAQIRLLADPLKLRLLQAFALGEKTTKQVAAELGESVTKLYRHVDALHDVGLLEIVSETQKRGTVERTFRAVARRFEADHALFTAEAGAEGTQVIRDLLRAGEAEILDALATAPADEEPDFIVTRFRVRGSPERIAELRQELTDWVEQLQDVDDDQGDDVEEAGALIAFYPIRSDD